MKKQIDYGQLERMVAKNVSIPSICSVLGISRGLYYIRKEKDVAFADAVARGRQQRAAGVDDGDDVIPTTVPAPRPQLAKRLNNVPKSEQPSPKASAVSETVIGKMTTNFYDDGSIMVQMRGEFAKEVLRTVFAK